MNQPYIISITLDKRRKKKKGTYPVRLRVFIPETKAQKLYGTKFDFTVKEFSSTWTEKPRKEYKENKKPLLALLVKANEVADKINPFNFEDFERLMFGKTGTKQNVNYYFDKAVERHKKRGSISTATSYEYALQCLLRFHEKENINFKDISVSYLEQFEKFCIEKEGKSITTVGIYLRNLRAVFNEAIGNKTITSDIYPFGKKKYQIKTGKKAHKALTPEQLKTLFEGKPETPEQEKAKAFWFFSYLSNGMNMKDILKLKCSNIEGDKVTFVRAKTENATQEQKQITFYLNHYTKQVIEKYGNLNQSANSYIFPVFNYDQTPEEQESKKLAFIRFVNQHFRKYTKSLGIQEKASTYWARHSFTTIAIQKGMSMEFIGEALGHTDMKTTIGYFAGFEDETKKDLSSKLLDF